MVLFKFKKSWWSTFLQRGAIAALLIAWVFTGYPQLWDQKFPPKIEETKAAVIAQYTGGLLVYADGTAGTPKYKVFDDTGGFGAEQSASSVGAAVIEWIRVAASPTNDEWIIATRDAGDVLKVQVCTGVDGGVSCGTPTTVTATAGTHGFRNFDVAYEQTSGDALLVFGTATVDELARMQWTGGAWSASSTITTTRTGGAVEWVELTSRNASDQIGIAYSDTADDVSAYRWDGSSAADEIDAVITAAATAVNTRKFDVAFEGTSGDMFVAAQVAAAGTWALGHLTGTTWSHPSGTGVDQVGAYINIADGDASTDYLAITSATTNVMEGASWSGTAIVDSNSVPAETSIATFADSYELAGASFVSATYAGVAVYSDTTGVDDINWFTMGSTGTWTDQAANDNLRTRGTIRFINLFDYPNADKVLLISADSASDLWADTWDGSAPSTTVWADRSGGAALEDSLSTAITRSHDFAFRLAPIPPPTNLTQTSYRWQNDDGDSTGDPTTGGNANNDTNSTTADDTILEMEKGERATWRVQLENSGTATTTSFKLQWATTTGVCDDSLAWADVGESTEIAWSDGLAGTNGDSITSAVCATNANTWANGKWFEATNTTGSFTLNMSKYTELAFMLQTSNATVDTDYCLQLVNETANIGLDGYTSYGKLSIVPSATKKYSKDAASSISDSDYDVDLAYYSDNEGYDDIASDDGNSDAVTGAAATYPVFLFAEQNTNNTDETHVTWTGSSTVNCATDTVYLQVYNSTLLQWETFDSSTACTAGVDFSLQGDITTNLGDYYDYYNWRFVRVYQASGVQQTLRTDSINIASQTAVDESHYRWRNDDGGEAVPWFDPSWSYRKIVPIQNTTSILTDYQVRVDVGYNSATFDVNCQSNCQADFDDVRFTANDGVTPLEYWREAYVTSASSTFWIKVPSLPADSTTNIYMYYGNGAVATDGNGDNTFTFFDDFSGSYPGSKWTGATSFGTVTAGILDYYESSVTKIWRKIYSASTYAPSYALRTRAMFESTYLTGIDSAIGLEAVACCAGRAVIRANGLTTNDDSGTGGGVGSAWNYDTWYTFDVTQVSGTLASLYVNDVFKGSTVVCGTLAQNVSIGSYRDRNFTDWIFVRQYVSPEPSIGTQGSQEASGGATWMAAEDTPVSLTSTQQSNNIRVRFLLKNSGYSADSYNYRLQYALLSGAANCTSVAEGNFSDVPTSAGSAVQMTASGNFADQDPTTNFGGSLTDPAGDWTWTAGKIVENPSNETNVITLGEYEFTELEYNFKFAAGAPDGTTYCFRAAKGDGGTATPLNSYSQIAKITTKGDVTVSTIGSQTASLDIPSTGNYIEGGFVIQELTGSRNVTGITITEQGTVDAQNNLENIKLFYDLDTTAPYNCASEQYNAGVDEQFGSTDADGFSSANGTASFTETVGISTTAALCVYVVLDVKIGASVGQTLEIQITDPSTEVTLSSGTIGPPSALPIPGTTELAGLEEVHYRWREDSGGELLTDWLYKKSIDIYNSGGALTDFQVRVDVGYNTTSGVDASCEGLCQNDFDDIRFTNSDGTAILNYWRESYTASASSTFWIKIPSLPAGDTTTIYIYYGNSNASTASNGVNTFIFFDDFEDNNYEDKWVLASGMSRNYWGENAGVLQTLMDGQRFIYLKNRTSDNSSPEIHEFKVKWGPAGTATQLAGMMWQFNYIPPNYISFYQAFYYDVGKLVQVQHDGTNIIAPIAYTGSYNSWYHFLLKIKGSNNYHLRVEKYDETNVISSDFSDSSHTSGYIGLGSYGDGTGAIEAYYDDYRIRKYAATEPSVTSVGSETAGGTGWMAAEDTATTTAKNTNIRVRFSLKNTGATTQNYNYRLQYALLGGAANCTLVADGNFSDVPATAGSAVIMATSPWFTGCPEVSQQSTTHQLSDISGVTWAAGEMVEYDCNQTASISLGTNYYTEPEFNFKFTDDAADDTAYCFRAAKIEAGTAVSIGTYSQIAKITTEAGEGYLYFSVDSSSQIFPSLSPGNLVATSSILTVSTDNSSGFNIRVVSDSRATSDNVMDDNADPDNNIPDKTEWIAPAATTTTGNATIFSIEPQTLQFRVKQTGTDIANYASSWWGADDTSDNALFAGFASSTASTINTKIIIRSIPAVATTTANILYNLDVPVDQTYGTYSGSITYIAVVNL